MKNYLSLFKIYNERRKLNHKSNIKIIGYKKLFFYLPILFIVLTIIIINLTVNIPAETLTLMPILSGIFITYLFNLKMKFQTNPKYDTYKTIFLNENGKITSMKFRVFDEQLGLLEYSIFLLIINFFIILLAPIINNNNFNISCLMLFFYSFIVTIGNIENFSTRLQ